MAFRRLCRIAAALAAVAIIVCLAAAPTIAHPLGNTSVNVYERVRLSSDAIRVRYVLDVSEIPALEETRFADTNDDGTVDDAESVAYLDGLWVYVEPKLTLVVGGQPVILTREMQTLTFPPGQGGLSLLRVVFDLVGPHPSSPAGAPVDATLTEVTFEGIPGWHEMIVQAGTGVGLVESSVPGVDLTAELTAYPTDRLDDPLTVRQASFQYVLDASPSAPTPGPTAQPGTSGLAPSLSPPPLPGGADPDPGAGGRPTDPLVALVGRDASVAALGIGTLVAAGLGALHALSPGHGKTLVAAYLIGTRANVRQGLWLGLTVAVTHTAGVFVLGVLTYVAARSIVPDQVVRWLSVISGGLIVLLGGALVWRAWRARTVAATPAKQHSHGPHGEHVSHSHPHGGVEKGHAHAVDITLRRRDVAAIGVVGGLIPSGSALLLLLSSVALEQVAFGIILIVAFGVGMAVVLAGISIGIVLMRRSPVMGWEGWADPRLTRVARAIPVISGLVVMVFGLLLTFQAVQSR